MMSLREFLGSSVGGKLVMASTGGILVLFLAGHLLGNVSVFSGQESMNAYAFKLHGLGPFVWIFRIVMITVFCLHVFFGIRLSLQNRAAKPQGYAVRHHLRATFASKAMLQSGLVILGFVSYHLVHFTFQIIDPAVAARMNQDGLGRPDVYRMLVLSFQGALHSILYMVALAMVFLHLSHGVQSVAQTFGLTNDKTLPAIEKAGMAAALILFAGFSAIPLAILAGLVRI